MSYIHIYKYIYIYVYVYRIYSYCGAKVDSYVQYMLALVVPFLYYTHLYTLRINYVTIIINNISIMIIIKIITMIIIVIILVSFAHKISYI